MCVCSKQVCAPHTLAREYSGASSAWQSDRATLQSGLQSAEADAAAQLAANVELQEGLRALEAVAVGGDAGVAELRAKYTDTVRRMAIVQVGGEGS
jgi:hypothetical protein